MSRLPASALPILLLGVLGHTAQARDGGTTALSGCYRGTVSDGSGEHAITTRFDRDAARGRYTFDNDGDSVQGALSTCREVSAGRVHCRWRDRFGIGDLHLQVAADGSGFHGRWSTDDVHGELDWNGRRVACTDGPE